MQEENLPLVQEEAVKEAEEDLLPVQEEDFLSDEIDNPTWVGDVSKLIEELESHEVS